MPASKLRLYADALRMLADARLALISDDVESRYALDDAWDEAVIFCMRQAAWLFALKTAFLAESAAPGGPVVGYAIRYDYPAGWLRTHAIMLIDTDGREHPVDIREHAGPGISSDAAGVSMRFVSDEYANPDATDWPEHFSQTVAAYLAFLVADRVTGEHGASGRISQLFSQLLGEAIRVDAIPDSAWLQHQRSGDMVRATLDVLRRADWRFALQHILICVPVIPGVATPVSPYTFCFAHPADYLRTHRAYLPRTNAAVERPFDVRDQAGFWSTNEAEFQLTYVSRTLGLNTRLWPEPFRTVVLTYLEAGMPHDALTESAKDKADPASSVQERFVEAAAVEAAEPDKWIAHQLSGLYEKAKRVVMGEGFWVYRDPDGVQRGLQQIELSALDNQLPTQPAHGLPYRYPLPTDWFRTHALFTPWDGQECPINIRENAHDWSTDAPSFVARYLSTEILDSRTWPELIEKTVMAYAEWHVAPPQQVKAAAEEYAALLNLAKERHARPTDDMLRFQLDGRFEQEKRKLIESGRWRFAIKTVTLTESTDELPAEESDGTPSQSYALRFILPTDLMRTVRVYYGTDSERCDIDFREEQGALHANYRPIVVRYVSRMALDSTKWPAAFRVGLRAYLLHIENPTNPVLKKNYEDACAEAEHLDDGRDRPRVKHGRFAAARRGSRGFVDQRFQGWS